MMSKLTLITLAVLLSWTTTAFAASLDGRQGDDDDSGPLDNGLVPHILTLLDVNRDHLITKEELENNALLPVNPCESFHFMRYADRDRNGYLTNEELIVGLKYLHIIFPTSDGACSYVFRFYDLDNDRYITEMELITTHTNAGRYGNISRAFNNIDSNGNGRIDYHEFAESFSLADDQGDNEDSGPSDKGLVWQIITLLDVNGDSLITKEELENNSLLPLNPCESSSYIRMADYDSTGTLTYEEVNAAFKMLHMDIPASVGACSYVFRFYDLDKDGNITTTELARVSYRYGPPILGAISSVFNIFDSNDNGGIDYHEFAKILPLAQDLGVEILSCIALFDANNNVMISKEELKNNTILPLSMSDVNSFVAFVDTSGDGSIDANEFDIGFSKLQQSPSASEDARRLVFKIFDINDDGNVNAAELQAEVPIVGPLAQGDISSIFSDFDDNNDGGISYEEFANYLPLAKEQ